MAQCSDRIDARRPKGGDLLSKPRWLPRQESDSALVYICNVRSSDAEKHSLQHAGQAKSPGQANRDPHSRQARALTDNQPEHVPWRRTERRSSPYTQPSSSARRTPSLLYRTQVFGETLQAEPNMSSLKPLAVANRHSGAPFDHAGQPFPMEDRLPLRTSTVDSRPS